jgi:hypothetical protein
MGQQIGEGLQKAASAIGGAYKQNADAKSDYNATQAMLRSPSYFKLFGLDKESAAELSKDLANTQGEAGYSAANKVFSQLADPLIKYAEIGKRFSQEQDLIGLRNNAAIQQAAIAEYLKLKAIPSPGGGTSAQPSVGPTPQPTPVTPAPVVQPQRKKSPWEDYGTKKLDPNDMGF